MHSVNLNFEFNIVYAHLCVLIYIEKVPEREKATIVNINLDYFLQCECHYETVYKNVSKNQESPWMPP